MSTPIGLNIQNPQEQISSVPIATNYDVSYGGNAIGPNASTNTSSGSSSGISTILIYGAIALAIIYILKKWGN